MHKLITRTLVSVCLTAAIPLMANAQTVNPTADEPSAPHMSQHHQQRAFSLPSERVDARLAYLKTALKIASAQESEWNAYADVMRKLAREGDEHVKSWQSGMKDGMQHHRRTAIERLEREQSFHAAAIAKLNEILPVAKPLYAALTPQQKLVADEVLVPHHRMMSGHGSWQRGR